MERQNFCRASGKLLCLSTNFPHQEARWNYCILRIDTSKAHPQQLLQFQVLKSIPWNPVVHKFQNTDSRVFPCVKWYLAYFSHVGLHSRCSKLQLSPITAGKWLDSFWNNSFWNNSESIQRNKPNSGIHSKLNNANTKKARKICSKSRVKEPEQCHDFGSNLSGKNWKRCTLCPIFKGQFYITKLAILR